MDATGLRVSVVASGSTGDVRPYAVLAGGLARAGHRVRFLANPGYEALAREQGVDDCHPYWIGQDELVELQGAVDERGRGAFSKEMWDGWFASYPDILAGCRDSDVLVGRSPLIGGFARLLGIPFCLASNLPAFSGPGARVPHVGPGTPIPAFTRLRRAAAAVPGLQGAVDRATHLARIPATVRLLWAERRNLRHMMAYPRRHRDTLLALADDAGRARLAGGVEAPPALSIAGISPRILPPTDGTHYTGLWQAPAEAMAVDGTAAVERFLATGPPPVYIGFGSCRRTPRGDDFTRLSRVVADAVARAGCRAILYRGWGGLDRPADAAPDDRVLVTDGLPHEWLFPRVAAVVHHGGSGTTLTGLWHGRPTVVVPFGQDMFFWAWRLYELGVAPAPCGPDGLDAGRLAALLRAVLHDPALGDAAARLGTALRAEDGLSRAVALFDRRFRPAAVTPA